jgi:ComF family protein
MNGPSKFDSGLERLGGWLLPPRCVLCGGPGRPPALDLCVGCESELPCAPPACPRCASPRSASTSDCEACASEPPPYARCHAAFAYAAPVDLLVQALKYRGRLALGRVLGELLAASLTRAGPLDDIDVVLPVPLHPSRRAERGFNQAAEIARWTARRLGIGCDERLARRRIANPPQVLATLAQRRVNLRGAFGADAARVAGRRLAIVDDVVTTGSTARALAATLLEARARRVDLWCVAVAGAASADGPADAAVEAGTLTASSRAETEDD